ncbi:MAG: hypothetical protein D6730_11190 [Bacteroidetes bacterium]|nr:MAG: hypothetical protein D6730_11190 [Bacteroidota bacterium]
MKFLFRFLLILILGFFLMKVLPFWSAALAAFVVGLGLSEKRKRRMFAKKQAYPFSFWAGFLAMFLLWGGMAVIKDQQNGGLLSAKIAQLITRSAEADPSGSWTMILAAALIGGLLGGFGSLSGNLLGEAIKH